MIIKLQTKSCQYPEEVNTIFGIETCSDSKINEFAKYLSKICNWDKVLTLMNSIPMKYNDREMRFFKSWVLQLAIQKHSNGILHFVGMDGFDFYVNDPKSKYHQFKIELKSGKNIFSKTDSFELKNQNKKTTGVTLSNTNGSSLDRQYEKKYDFLLLLDKSGYAVTTYEKVFPHVKNNGDGFRASIPINVLEVVCMVDEHTVRCVDINVPDALNDAALKIIEAVENA
jgi:hypothetical protein